MSVTKPEIVGFDGFRVRRRVRGRTMQKYFPKESEAEAIAYDRELEAMQKAARAKKVSAASHNRGSLVRNISVVVRKWKLKSGEQRVRRYFCIQVEGHKAKLVAIEETKRGVQEAWQSAVNCLAQLRGDIAYEVLIFQYPKPRIKARSSR